jgi:hypothetical protein
MENKDYLGDGVYVGIERGMIALYTSNGRETTNMIYLEPEVLGAFLRYLERVKNNYE